MQNNHVIRKGLPALALAFSVAAPAGADTVDFGIQAWPGVTVKTEVAAQLLATMGYDTATTELSSSAIYQGIRNGDIDVSLGAWMPAHESMLQPLLDDDAAIQHAVNLRGAVQGLAVPADVYEDGVTSVEELVAEGERFERTIYAIEPGAGMTRAFRAAVEEDYKGLGDWNVVPSSVAGMMAQVDRSVQRDQAVVFHGWKPHWMDVVYDIRFLSDQDGSDIADIETTVYTVVRSGWPEDNPQASRFLEQMEVPLDAQSVWIKGLSRDEREADAVAEEWIRGNLEIVEDWLEGVRDTDGEPGIEAVRERYGS